MNIRRSKDRGQLLQRNWRRQSNSNIACAETLLNCFRLGSRSIQPEGKSIDWVAMIVFRQPLDHGVCLMRDTVVAGIDDDRTRNQVRRELSWNLLTSYGNGRHISQQQDL